MLSIFYNHQDNVYHAFHIPTLRKGVKQFYEDKKSFTLSRDIGIHWLASLFSALAHSCLTASLKTENEILAENKRGEAIQWIKDAVRAMELDRKSFKILR
jgi:hypothetical protein